ncbi:MAG: DoxX family protein [Verrucomicrobia bacterium]|nr:DoxX family protein [Verrucomicrobiota bacterium]
MKTIAPAALLHRLLSPDLGEVVVAWGLLALRVGTGALIFYVHGWHKLEGGIALLRDGTPWRLAEEVGAMHFPAPVASAFAATAAQFVFAPLLALGCFTRLSAAILTAVLGVAILQNLLAQRDPQLALLYTLIVASFVLIGGGRFSLDARLSGRAAIPADSRDPGTGHSHS